MLMSFGAGQLLGAAAADISVCAKELWRD